MMTVTICFVIRLIEMETTATGTYPMIPEAAAQPHAMSPRREMA